MPGELYTERGSLLSTTIFVYAATAPVSGYFGGSLYARMGGKVINFFFLITVVVLLVVVVVMIVVVVVVVVRQNGRQGDLPTLQKKT